MNHFSYRTRSLIFYLRLINLRIKSVAKKTANPEIKIIKELFINGWSWMNSYVEFTNRSRPQNIKATRQDISTFFLSSGLEFLKNMIKSPFPSPVLNQLFNFTLLLITH